MVKLRLLVTLSLTQRASMPISSSRDTEAFVFLGAVRIRAVVRLIDRLVIVKLILVQHLEHDLSEWLADKIDQSCHARSANHDFEQDSLLILSFYT
jgi:hypothetical protein